MSLCFWSTLIYNLVNTQKQSVTSLSLNLLSPLLLYWELLYSPTCFLNTNGDLSSGSHIILANHSVNAESRVHASLMECLQLTTIHTLGIWVPPGEVGGGTGESWC